MIDENFLKSIKQSLIDTYDRYKDKGIGAVYLCGSITTPDFDIKTSDIDSVGIVKDFTDIGIKDDIQKELSEWHPEVVKFGFNIAYEGELSGKFEPRSGLSKSILPRLLLLDFPNWVWVAGEQYKVSDFTDNPPAPEEGLYWRLTVEKNLKNTFLCSIRSLKLLEKEQEKLNFRSEPLKL